MNNLFSQVKNQDRELTIGSAEWRMLVLTACLNPDEESLQELKALLGEEVDWGKLIFQSSVHGTAGLLYQHLMKLSDEFEIPPGALEELRTAYFAIAASGLRLMGEFRKIADALVAAGIETIPIKGAVLAEKIYGDLGFRPLSDIDLLVRENDWPRVYEILAESGYEFASRDLLKHFREIPAKLTRYDVQSHMQYESPVGTALEFQFDLFTLGIGMYDMAGVWQRSSETEVGGVRVRTLGAEDELLLLAIHANRHGCSRLKWLVDIVEILRQNRTINWDLLITIARREHILANVYMTLSHIQRLFKLQLIEPAIMERMKPRTYKRMLWNAVWPRKELDLFQGRNEDSICFYFYRPFSGWNLVNFAIMGRVRDKTAYQVRWLVPSLTWMSQTYKQPRSLGLLKYYPVRLLDRQTRRKNQASG